MMTDTEEAPGAAPASPAAENPDEPTAELPKSILAGKEFKPGEEVILKIVEVRDNSVLVAYSYGDDEEETEEEPTTEEEPAAGGGAGYSEGGSSNPGNPMY